MIRSVFSRPAARRAIVCILFALFLAAMYFGAAAGKMLPVRAEDADGIFSDGGTATTSLDVNPVKNDPSMPAGGLANMPSGCIAGGANGFDTRAYMVTADNPPPQIPAGSADNKVIYMEMLDSHQGLARLEFQSVVAAEKVESIRIKMYVSLDDDTSSDALIKGGHYVMADRYDMQSRYWYELGLRCNEQLQWITVEIGGPDVMRLADEEGNIGALYIYYDTYSYAEKPSRNGHIFIDEISYTLATEEDNEGGAPYLTTFSPRTAVLDTDPRMNDDEISDDTGLANMPVGCVGGGGGFGSRATDLAELPAGSSDGFGYSFEILNSHQSLAHIAFMQYKDGSVLPYAPDAADLGGIAVKIYVDLEADSAPGVPVKGKYYLLADRYDMENKYWYELEFTCDMQRQWTWVHIRGEALSLLADEEGKIGGLYFYYDTYSHASKPTGGTIFFDEIRFDEYTLTFADGGTQSLLYGERAQMPEEPTSPGLVFGGWCTQEDCSEESLYDFSLPVTGDMTLYAWWAEEAAAPLASGLYRAGEEEISVYPDGSLYIGGVAAYGTPYVCGNAGTDRIFFRSGSRYYSAAYGDGEILFGGKTYVPSDYFTVCFRFYADEQEEHFVHAGGQAQDLASPVRPGYIFRFWSEDGQTPFDFTSSVTQDMTLSAVWDYDEAENASAAVGTYYDGTSEKIILSADGTGTHISEGGQTTLRYYLLTSGNLVLEEAGESLEVAFDPLLKTFRAGDREFTALRWYAANFYSDGTLYAQVILKEGLYLLSEPQAPVKEGYTFRGWTLSDGGAFDFSKTVTESVSLYAIWEYSGPAPQKGDGWVWWVVAASAVVAACSVAAIVWVAVRKNKAK